MRYLLLLTLSSCSLLTPSLPSVPNVSPTPKATPTATTTVGQVSKDIESSLYNYSWIAIILTFCFPSLRAPIVFFLKSIFGLLALFPDLAVTHIRMLYNKKYGGNRDA